MTSKQDFFKFNQAQPSIPGELASQAGSEAHIPLEWVVGDLILDTYAVRDVIRTGGMAFVYRVYHRDWGIDLAVKSPRPEMLGFDSSVDHFVLEAETWVNLGLHPHIVSCYYIRVLGGVPRIFMEYVNGGSLLEAIERGTLYLNTPDKVLERILDYAIQSCWGLQYAHQRGLVHQDIKPANMLITREGILKVTDFGMARAKEAIRLREGISKPIQVTSDGKTVMVDTTGLTPLYCSPEQASMSSLSRRTDIWSWGLCLLEMFIGRKTWKSGTLARNSLENYLNRDLENPDIPRMPAALADLLRQCFSVDPEDRPRNVQQISEVLSEIYFHETGQPYPRSQPKTETKLADTLNNRGVSMIDLGRAAEASRIFEEAIKVESNHPAAVYNRGILQWRSAQVTDLDLLSTLYEVMRDQAKTWEPAYYMALVHLERGDNLLASRVCRSAVEKYGDLTPLSNLIRTAEASQLGSGYCLKTISGSDCAINSLDISATGKLVLSGSNDFLVRLWNASTGDCLRTLTGHTHRIRAVKFSPNGRLALSASWDETVRLWDLENGECLQVFKGHSDFVQDAAFTPDGFKVLTASSDHTLRLWDVHTGQTLSILYGHTDTVWALVVAPDGKTAVSAAFDNTIRSWNLQTGECLQTIRWQRSCTSNLSLTQDGKKLLLAAGDNDLWLVDLVTGEAVRSMHGHTGGVNAVQVAPNGEWALSAGEDSTLRLWDLNTGRCLRTFTGHSSSVNSIAISLHKALAVTGSSDQTIRLWRLVLGQKAPYITVLPRSSEEIIELSDQVETRLISAKQEYRQGNYAAALEEISRARELPQYQQNPRLLEYYDFLGQKAVRSGFRSAWLVNSISLPSPEIHAVELMPDILTAVTGSEDGGLLFWDLETGACIRQIEGSTSPVRAIAVAASSGLALTGCNAGGMQVWDLARGVCQSDLCGHTSDVNSVDISPDGRLGLSASNDQQIRLWDLHQGICLKVLKGHTHFVRRAVLVPGGCQAVSAGWDMTVRLWDLAAGECLRVFSGHSEVIDAMAVSPDGRFVASGGLDHDLRLWHLPSGDLALVMKDLPERVKAVRFSVDGRYIYSGLENGSILILDRLRGECLRSFTGHLHSVSQLAATSNGRFLISLGHDRSLKRWYLDWEYALPPQIELDETLVAYLNSFLYQRKPYARDGVQRTGQVTWNDRDLDDLLLQLSYRGYGGLSGREVDAALRNLTKRTG